MSQGHVHVTTQCEHGTRLGGCKCIGYVENERIEVIACRPPCPETPGYRPTWDDIYMGEPDE